MRQGNPDFMNGVPELLILKLLAAREMYGYELVQSIREQTNEAIHEAQTPQRLKQPGQDLRSDLSRRVDKQSRGRSD
jgi:hypothetical protein